MNEGQLPANLLDDINWGALNHASHAPKFMSCFYHNCVCVCVCVCVCTCVCVSVCIHPYVHVQRLVEIL